jgi:mRNA-degrading endonuclease RelE of RelBE toxin-antitoxin system
MIVKINTSFDRDVKKVKDKYLKQALMDKIEQIEKAQSLEHITGIILLKGYSTYYRIKVKTETKSYRIGAIVRYNTIWLVRFLPRRKVYQLFP